jgi:hypothetical protein
MRAADHRHGVRGAALLRVVLVVAALGLTACGSDGDAHRKARPTSAGEAKTPAATATPTPDSASAGGRPRTVDAVLKAVAGRHVHVDGKTVRIDPATVTCGGSGDPVRRRRGAPEWTRFNCIQPTFPKGQVAGPDLLFVVESVPPRGFRITHRYLTKY